MTQDEIDIETYRYRAPKVIPLDGDRYAVISASCTIIVGPGDLREVITLSIEANTLPPRKQTPTSTKPSLDALEF